MPNFPVTVSGPQAPSYAAPLLDFSPISNLANKFYEGASNRRDYDAAEALKGGLPTLPDGSIDYAAAAQLLAKSGNINAVTSLAKIDAMRQKVDNQASLTPKIKEYEYARANGFTGTFPEWLKTESTGKGEYGLQPIWGRDKDGNPVMLQAGKGGDAIRTKLPDGVSLSGKDAIKLDAGTHFVLIDPLTRQQVGIIKKDIEGKEKAEEVGKAAGTAEVMLPVAITKAAQASKLIDDMIAHPGRETATGLSGFLHPSNYIPGTDAKNFQVRQKQLQGTVFLEAFQSLKGGGAITEVEGAKAEAAIARLDRSQSDDEYLAALKELKDIVRTGLINARKKAAGSSKAAVTGAEKAGMGDGTGTADALAEARAAIAKGADRNAVIERLKQNSIDPAGL